MPHIEDFDLFSHDLLQIKVKVACSVSAVACMCGVRRARVIVIVIGVVVVSTRLNPTPISPSWCAPAAPVADELQFVLSGAWRVPQELHVHVTQLANQPLPVSSRPGRVFVSAAVCACACVVGSRRCSRADLTFQRCSTRPVLSTRICPGAGWLAD